jgi:hypothetical protein
MRITAAALLLIAPLPAMATQRGPAPVSPQDQPAHATIMAEPVAVMIAAFDTDGDAQVTRAECEAGVARTFKSIDTTGKGWLGYIEFADWAERWLGDRNALPSPYETDTDGDNHITLAELQAKIATIFNRLDKNKDGVLTRAELLTLDNSHGLGNGFGERGRRGGRPPQ